MYIRYMLYIYGMLKQFKTNIVIVIKKISNVLNSKLFDVAWNSSWTQHCTVLGRCS